MKKCLKVVGQVSLSRNELTKIVLDHLEKVHSIKGETVSYPVNFEELVVNVNDRQEEGKITQKLSPAPKLERRPYRSHRRPNYGISSFIAGTIFTDPGDTYTLEEVYKLCKDRFPQLKKDTLKNYLSRKDMLRANIVLREEKYVREQGEYSK